MTRVTQTVETTDAATEEELYEYINTLENTLSLVESSLQTTRLENAALRRSIAAYRANSTRRRAVTQATNVA